jgi:LmbE family N-acetylglucosaminyl deacetylase
MRPVTRDKPTSSALPSWSSVLAVVAHPDDESFALGAVLHELRRAGSRTAVLCLTHGEASTLRATAGELAEVRAREFSVAAQRLGVTETVLRDYPDGGLRQVCLSRVAGDVLDAVKSVRADGLLTFDVSGVTGHPDHAAATEAALLAAAGLDLPVLGWTIPSQVADQLNREFGAGFTGHRPGAIDIALRVAREPQLFAVAAHVSQAVPSSVLWRRLELLGELEHLRWLS